MLFYAILLLFRVNLHKEIWIYLHRVIIYRHIDFIYFISLLKWSRSFSVVAASWSKVTAYHTLNSSSSSLSSSSSFRVSLSTFYGTIVWYTLLTWERSVPFEGTSHDSLWGNWCTWMFVPFAKPGRVWAPIRPPCSLADSCTSHIVSLFGSACSYFLLFLTILCIFYFSPLSYLVVFHLQSVLL